MSGQRIIALLGRRDQPTDAVEEYCRFLGEAARAYGLDLQLERVSWAEHGWASALRKLTRKAAGWRKTWILVQYTALAWSARGFPLRILRVLKILKAAGARVMIVYHDVEPYTGQRVIDKLRRRVQLRTMRESLRMAERAVFTVPLERLSWIQQQACNARFIPVGANLPIFSEVPAMKRISSDGKLNIAVFGVTGGAAGQKEIERIGEAVRFAASRIKNVRLLVFGRNAQSAEAQVRKVFQGCGVEIQVLGVLPDAEVAKRLLSSDVLLFVRGHISTRRSSAIAGIACGLPVVAFAGPETAPPITDAGLALFSPERKGDLGDVLVRVLEDEHNRTSLAQQSWLAQAQYFAWPVIAAQYAEFIPREE